MANSGVLRLCQLIPSFEKETYPPPEVPEMFCRLFDTAISSPFGSFLTYVPAMPERTLVAPPMPGVENEPLFHFCQVPGLPPLETGERATLTPHGLVGL